MNAGAIPQLITPNAASYSAILNGQPSLSITPVTFGDMGTAEGFTLAPIFQVPSNDGATAEGFTMAIILQV